MPTPRALLLWALPSQLSMQAPVVLPMGKSLKQFGILTVAGKFHVSLWDTGAVGAALHCNLAGSHRRLVLFAQQVVHQV